MRLIQQEVALAVRPVERLTDTFGQRVSLLEECRCDNAWARLEGDPDLELVGAFVVRGALIVLWVAWGQVEDRDPLAVDAQLELVWFPNRSTGKQVEELQLDVVVAIPWEVVRNGRATARTKR